MKKFFVAILFVLLFYSVGFTAEVVSPSPSHPSVIRTAITFLEDIFFGKSITVVDNATIGGNVNVEGDGNFGSGTEAFIIMGMNYEYWDCSVDGCCTLWGTGGADNTDITFCVDGDGPVISSDTDTTITVEDSLVVVNNGPSSFAFTIRAVGGANGFNDTITEVVSIVSGDLGPAQSVAGMLVTADVSLAVSADNTTSIPCYIAGTTGNSDAQSKAFVALVGFDVAFQVQGSPASSPGYGYEVTSGTVVDRVNSGGGGNDAFVNNAVNVEIVDTVNDYILIGSDNTFEVIDVELSIASSKDCLLNFYYSKAGGNWTALNVTETSDGFQNNGEIFFPAPIDWTKDDEAEVNADITNAYYVKIERTYVPNIPTLPTELFFRLFADRQTGMEIRGDGIVRLPYISSIPANPVNGHMWMESDGLHVYYNDAERIVTDGAP